MSEPAYRVLSIVLRVFSLLAAIGGLFMKSCRQTSRGLGLPATTRGGGFDPPSVTLQGNGWHHAHGGSAPVACRTQSGAQHRRRRCADCRAMHSLRDTASLALGDRHSEYLPGVSLVGTIRCAARNSSLTLLAEAAGDALGTCRRFLKIEE